MCARLSPVVSPTAVQLFSAITCEFDLQSWQADVSATYLRSTLAVPLYMNPPKPIQLPDKGGRRRCYRVDKGIYGCRQGGIRRENRVSAERNDQKVKTISPG